MNNNINNDTFEFGNNEQNINFNYSNLNGIGESNYENEDLFNTEVYNQNDVNNNVVNTEFQHPILPEQSSNVLERNEAVSRFNQSIVNFENKNEVQNESVTEKIEDVDNFNYTMPLKNEILNSEVQNDTHSLEENINYIPPQTVDINYQNQNNNFNENFIDTFNYKPDLNVFDMNTNTLQEEEKQNKFVTSEEMIPTIPLQDTKQTTYFNNDSDDINKLTEFKEEKIDVTDIRTLFDKVGVNVKEASDIFRKNTEMKDKLDTRFEELKKLQSEVEKSKKNQYEEINKYKEEVLEKLTSKKDEIEQRLNKLKEFQSTLEKEKEEFEEYKRKEKKEIEKVQREIQNAYDARREELNHIEEVLRKQKDMLDDERNQLSLDRIQYESDKNDLANNLLKFNEIVNSFTDGMDKVSSDQN